MNYPQQFNATYLSSFDAKASVLKCAVG